MHGVQGEASGRMTVRFALYDGPLRAVDEPTETSCPTVLRAHANIDVVTSRADAWSRRDAWRALDLLGTHDRSGTYRGVTLPFASRRRASCAA